MADKLGPYLNIDRFLGKAKNRIHLVGVELEGGWNKDLAGYPVILDRSVRFVFPSDDKTKTVLISHIGEIPLPPLAPHVFPAVMTTYYPSYVNHTCGMHVHLSTLKTFQYQRLMVNRPFSFPGTVVEYIQRWATAEKLPSKHPIWPRLRDENEFCQHLFQADEQTNTALKDFDHHRPGHRYTVIGYCWRRYKTLECRLLPMMDTAEQAVRAVQELINITNAFLTASREKEPRLRATVSDTNDTCIEEKMSYI